MKMAFPVQLSKYVSRQYLSAEAVFFDSHKAVGFIGRFPMGNLCPV